MRILIDGQTFETPEIHRGIGIYTKSVIERMIKVSYEHEWYIAVSDTGNLAELDPWVQKKLRVITAPEFAPGADYARNRAYTEKTQELIDRFGIDVLWIPNGMMVNVLFPEHTLSCRTCVTVYDLIPYIFPIKEWPSHITAEYRRRIRFLQENDIGLIMISQATCDDWEKHIGPCGSRAFVTPLAADARKFWCDISQRRETEPYILFTGGFDYRKNIDGAIDAFALARKKHADDPVFARYKLVIVGKYDAGTKSIYDEKLAAKGVSDCVVLTGFVSDEELSDLYHNADLFFFPSRYEGFGLPILEAMLAGNYVVSADNSSLPEVCGGYASLFDADSTQKAAEALYAGFLAHSKETQEDIRARQAYALTYSWDKTGMLTLEALSGSAQAPAKKPTLALFTPWPEQQTGIAHYEYKLCTCLQKYFQITVFAEDTVKASLRPLAGVELKRLSEYRPGSLYDYRLFQLGNNVEFHQRIFELLEQEGGLAEIHDYVLTPFFYHGFFRQKKEDTYHRLLTLGYGETAGEEFYQATVSSGNHPDIYLCPMSHGIAKLSSRVIFHNHWSVEQIGGGNTTIVPLAAFDMVPPAEEALKAARKKVDAILDRAEDELIISCFGWVNSNKRPRIAAEAVEKLIAGGRKVKLIFWGKCNDVDLQQFIKDRKLARYVKISGFLTDEEYFCALQAADIVVNLRYPSMGEASATLCEAMKMRKPIIVSDLNQYREFPDEVCWKLPVGDHEVELLTRYLEYLADHPEVRTAMGGNAGAYADYALDPEKLARSYYQIITGGDGK